MFRRGELGDEAQQTPQPEHPQHQNGAGNDGAEDPREGPAATAGGSHSPALPDFLADVGEDLVPVAQRRVPWRLSPGIATATPGPDLARDAFTHCHPSDWVFKKQPHCNFA